MKYMPEVGFMHQQHLTTSKENNVVYDPQTQEKTTIPPAPTATRPCKLSTREAHYTSTCETKGKADANLRYRIVLAINMAKIYLDPEHGHKDDHHFHPVNHIDKDDRMRDPYITCIRICPI